MRWTVMYRVLFEDGRISYANLPFSFTTVYRESIDTFVGRLIEKGMHQNVMAFLDVSEELRKFGVDVTPYRLEPVALPLPVYEETDGQ